MGELLNFSDPQFPQLYKGHSSATHLSKNYTHESLKQGLAGGQHSKCQSQWFLLTALCPVRAGFCLLGIEPHPTLPWGGLGLGVGTGKEVCHPLDHLVSNQRCLQDQGFWPQRRSGSGHPPSLVLGGGYCLCEARDWVGSFPCGFLGLIQGLAVSEGFIRVCVQ